MSTRECVPPMRVMGALITFSKRGEAFKEFDELLPTNVIEGLFHHHTLDLPIPLLGPQQMLLDSLRHRSLWKAHADVRMTAR